MVEGCESPGKQCEISKCDTLEASVSLAMKRACIYQSGAGIETFLHTLYPSTISTGTALQSYLPLSMFIKQRNAHDGC